MCERLPLAGEIDGLPVEDGFGELFQALMERVSEDEPDPLLTVQRRWIAAGDAAPLQPSGPCSVWAMAAAAEQAEAQPDLFGGTEFAPLAGPVLPPEDPPQNRKTVDKVNRSVKGRTVVSGLSYPNNRWTEERAAWERARRKMQTVPRPSDKAREFRVGKGAAA